MAAIKKKPAKNTAKKVQKKEMESPAVTTAHEVPKTGRKVFNAKNVLLLAVLLVALLAWRFKGVFVAATVNGQPISKWQLSRQLEKRFGSQVLDTIINERLILSAARQKGIFVTTDEINAKVEEIKQQLSGQMSLEDALKMQGLSIDDFRKQIEIQVSIDKMFESESTVSAKEVDDYIAQNSALLQNSTDAAKLKKDVEGMLKQQKTSEKFNEWFNEIKNSAKISKFL